VVLAEISPDVASKIILSVAILGGAALCFFGCRLFKFALGIAGFACGAAVAACVALALTSPDKIQAAQGYPGIIQALANSPNRTVLTVWAGAGGVAGAILSVLMHQVGVFVLGAWLGTMLANMTMVRATTNSYLIVVAILGLMGGVLALILRKTIMVLSTAFNGAMALMFGMYALLKSYRPSEALTELQKFGNDAYVVLGCTIILGAIGGFVQFVMMPKKEVLYKRAKSDKKDD